MKRVILPLMILLTAAVISSCGGGSDQDKTDGKDSVSNGQNGVDPNLPAYAKYGIKSAIIGMKSVTMGMEQQVTMYIDDYGRKHCTEFVTEVMGIKSHQVQIVDSIYIYSLDMKTRQGTRTIIDKNSPDNINFARLTDDMIKQFNIKKEGTEDLIGHSCDVYSLDFGGGKLKGKYYIWKGIALKTEATVGGIPVKMEATHIEENAVIPADKFVIPEGFKIRDIKADGAGIASK